MTILLLIKELITNTELIGVMIFAFIVLYFIFRDIQAISKCLLINVTLYIIVKTVLKLLVS